MTVRNRVVAEAVQFNVEIEHPRTFEFTGADCFEWTLEGGEELTIALQAIISSPGMYNLQHVRITVGHEGKMVPYVFPLQWMVLVKNLI